MKATTENAFELHITQTLSQNGWLEGDKTEWNREKGLFPSYLLAFLEQSQPQLWAQMQTIHGAELPTKLVAEVVKERQLKGTIHLIRHGFKFYGKTFKLAFFKPAHSLVPETLTAFSQNLLHVTRQVLCHPTKPSEMDLVLSLNGLPIASMELKNPGTGQTWRNAIHQYKTTRDPQAPLFQFKKGALVHFAVDAEEVHMTTRLEGEKTFFLPFNRGSAPGEVGCGKGNPPHPSGHRTAYFWEEVLERESFLDIIGNFVFVETREEVVEKDGKRQINSRETMVFPRYHQLDSVRKLLADSQVTQAGQNYLIQHSAGSGKTNSISWLAHRLSNLHTTTNQKIFDCVVVITDRRVLDKQLQDAVSQIEHAQGVVQAIDESAKQLAAALVDGTKIVITTLQKFPFILQGLLDIAGAEKDKEPDPAVVAQTKSWQAQIAARRYAIIVDEAHSSQSGESARELKRLLGAGTDLPPDEAESDWEDGFNQVLESRGRQKNISFFAFTATPKGKTLELFGRPGAGGLPRPFHTYTMKQAIEEGFILDVLQQYITYKTYYQLGKKVEDDPEMNKKLAVKKLTKFVQLHPHNISQKTEVIIEHFRTHVKSKLGGRAKAMVITSSRLQAVRYMNAFQKYLTEHGYNDIRPLVAFSGTVVDPDTGLEYTEPKMNIDVVTGKTISEGQLTTKFDSSDYQLLLVANKYQTGFDQPLLCAMYVDKRLDGVQAVQTLSRLNRQYPGKEAPFVLDFANEAETIYAAFKPYYEVTRLEALSDAHHLESLKHELDQLKVYLWSEVEAFCQIFYVPEYKQKASDNGRLEGIVAPAVDRFKLLPEEKKEQFYDRLTAYVGYYAFVSQVIPYRDTEWEKLYAFGRFLVPHLVFGEVLVQPRPEDNVALEYYRLEVTSSGSIDLDTKEEYTVTTPSAVGTGKPKDEARPLSEIISALNERFSTQFTEADRLFFEQILEKALQTEEVVAKAKANSLEKFKAGMKDMIKDLMAERLTENDQIVAKYLDEAEFQELIFSHLAQEIYRAAIGRG